MLKGMMSLLLCASLSFAQGVSLPFSMNGGGMQVQGTMTGSGGGGNVCCSGVVALGSEVVPFSGNSFPGPLGMSWRITLTFKEHTYIMWIIVKPNATTGAYLCGWFYETGTEGVPTPLYP